MTHLYDRIVTRSVAPICLEPVAVKRALLIVALALLPAACSQDQVTSPDAGQVSLPLAPPAHLTNPLGAGLLLLEGGGTLGVQGDTTAWSYKLYRRLLLNGDINGDGIVTTAIVGANASLPIPPTYIQWIGTTLGLTVVATHYVVPDIATANSPTISAAVSVADVVILEGGNEALYYDAWNGTLLETGILAAAQAGAAIGGSSAGAMALSQYCFCGNTGLQSSQVLQNARTIWLDDQSVPGTSAIHTDFLNVVAGIYVDPHFTTKGRLGRLMGVLARATDDNGDPTILAIGLDEKTGLVITRDTAEVIGTGEAAFVHQSPTTIRIRDAGRPLVYTDLVEDRLTDGWKYDLVQQAPVTATLPPGTVAVTYPGPGLANSGGLTIVGALETAKNSFQKVATYFPSNYNISQTANTIYVKTAVGFGDAGNSTTRGYKQETLFRAMYGNNGYLGVLAFSGDSIIRGSLTPDVVGISGNSAAILVDPQGTTFKSLSPYRSNLAITNGNLRAAALTNLRISAIGESTARSLHYDTRLHQIVP
jgi:cyanophycinase-like exopeptidase